MEHTTNYQLSLWEQDDRIMREDFNDNNQKIDTALSEKPYVIGAYTGDGVVAADGGQHITLGFHPRFIIISGIKDVFWSGNNYFAILSDQQINPHLTFTDDGFTVSHFTSDQSSYSLFLNSSDRIYGYIALR